MASVYDLHDIVIHQREPVMRIIVLSIFLICAGVAAPAGAETQLADPKPDFDNPRKIMLQLTSGDPKDMNNVLWNAINLQKFYGEL